MSAFDNNNKNLTSLKLTFNGEIRRLSVPSQGLTYQDLLMKTLSVFPHLSFLQFSWVDDENDTVIISSNEELSEALRIMATEEKKGYLRFEVLTSPATGVAKGTSTSKAAPVGTVTITHDGIMCSECAVYPLVGSRYKCSIRANYNVCEPKIYEPEQLSGDFDFKVLERKWLRHWGGRCNGCRIRLAAAGSEAGSPRFKFTVRKNFYLCQACERKDTHAHVMVKVYPQTGGKGLPRSPRGGKDGRNYQQGGNQPKPKPKGRHCWDRTSVAQAAAKRAKHKEEETSHLEDAMLEMCMQESLAEQEHKTAIAGITAASDTQAAGAGTTRGRGGRHCWDRASVTHAASMRAKRQACATVPVSVHVSAPLAAGQCESPKAKEDDASSMQLQLLKMRTKCLEKRSMPTTLRHLDPECTSKKQAVQWMIHGKTAGDDKTASDGQTDNKTAGDKTEDSSPILLATKPSATATPNNNFKESVKWVIAEEKTKDCVTKAKTSLVALKTETQVHPTSTLSSSLPCGEKELLKSEIEEVETQTETEAGTHVIWSHELQVLSDMGFTDRYHLLSLLQTHVVTPAASRPQQQTTELELTQQQKQHQEGMQAVVLALLSGAN